MATECSVNPAIKTRAQNQLLSILSGARKAHSAADGSRIYVDITNSVLHNGKPFGILRVEYGLAKELAKLGVTPVAWSGQLRAIVKLPMDSLEEGTYKEAVRNATSANIIDGWDRGAILVVPACQWWFNQNYLRDLTGIVRQQRIRLVQWIHDVVWSKYACWYEEKHVRDTSGTTARIIRESAGLLTYSHCSAEDIHDFCQLQGLDSPSVILVRASDEFACGNSAKMTNLEKIADDSGFVLYVSALQTRKNHRLLINLWHRLIAELPFDQVPSLVLVAHGGQESMWFDTLVAADATLKGKVKLLRDLEDEDMHWLYENCLFSVFPSLYEGWGLPVGESLAHGKICIASNASSVPEIAPDYTDLIDPLDFASWYERIRLYITDSEASKGREKLVANYTPTSWAESARKLLADLADIKLAAPDLETLPANKLISDFFNDRNRRYFGCGWKRFDKDGAWSDSAASILFRLPTGIDSANIMVALLSPQADCRLELLLNGQHVGNIHLPNAYRALEYHIDIYSDNCRDGGIQIEIRHKCADAKLAEFCLRRFKIAPLSRPEIRGAINELERICSPLARVAASLASKRSDLYAIAIGSHGGLALLFWAWRFGVGEETAVGRLWQYIEKSLKDLQDQNYDDALVPGYTALVDSLRKVRPELRQWSNKTEDGQRKLVGWFIERGIYEYNFHDIV